MERGRMNEGSEIAMDFSFLSLVLFFFICSSSYSLSLFFDFCGFISCGSFLVFKTFLAPILCS